MAHAKSLNFVSQPDNQPITRRCAGHGRQPVCDGIAHQPARLSLNRRNLNIAQRLRHGALTSTRIERTEAAARQAGSNQEPGKEALHTTRLTKRSGTKIPFLGVSPYSVRRSDKRPVGKEGVS